MKRIASAVSGFAMLAAALATAPALAGEAAWNLAPAESKIAYGSIKNNETGEVNHFKSISGGVAGDGEVTIRIDVTSVETLVDIRNERMVKYVFDAGRPEALLKAKIDMAALEQLEPGGTVILPVEGVLTLSGVDVDVETEMLVARLGDNRVLVSTSDMIMMDTDSLGINEGLDKLMEIAGLSGITRVTPVAMHLVFEKAS